MLFPTPKKKKKNTPQKPTGGKGGGGGGSRVGMTLVKDSMVFFEGFPQDNEKYHLILFIVWNIRNKHMDSGLVEEGESLKKPNMI